MNAVTDAPLRGGPSQHSVDPRERRRQLVYFAWSLALILLVNALYLSGVLVSRDAAASDPPEHQIAPAGVLAP